MADSLSDTQESSETNNKQTLDRLWGIRAPGYQGQILATSDYSPSDLYLGRDMSHIEEAVLLRNTGKVKGLFLDGGLPLAQCVVVVSEAKDLENGYTTRFAIDTPPYYVDEPGTQYIKAPDQNCDQRVFALVWDMGTFIPADDYAPGYSDVYGVNIPEELQSPDSACPDTYTAIVPMLLEVGCAPSPQFTGTVIAASEAGCIQGPYSSVVAADEDDPRNITTAPFNPIYGFGAPPGIINRQGAVPGELVIQDGGYPFFGEGYQPPGVIETPRASGDPQFTGVIRTTAFASADTYAPILNSAADYYQNSGEYRNSDVWFDGSSFGPCPDPSVSAVRSLKQLSPQPTDFGEITWTDSFSTIPINMSGPLDTPPTQTRQWGKRSPGHYARMWGSKTFFTTQDASQQIYPSTSVDGSTFTHLNTDFRCPFGKVEINSAPEVLNTDLQFTAYQTIQVRRKNVGLEISEAAKESRQQALPDAAFPIELFQYLGMAEANADIIRIMLDGPQPTGGGTQGSGTPQDPKLTFTRMTLYDKYDGWVDEDDFQDEEFVPVPATDNDPYFYNVEVPEPTYGDIIISIAGSTQGKAIGTQMAQWVDITAQVPYASRLYKQYFQSGADPFTQSDVTETFMYADDYQLYVFDARLYDSNA